MARTVVLLRQLDNKRSKFLGFKGFLMTGYQLELASGGEATINNIYCIGRSYAEHAAELHNPPAFEPVIFLKSLASLRSLNDRGRIAFPGESFHHEAELVLLIGKTVTTLTDCQWNAISHVGLGLDLTRRELQKDLKEKGLPWTRAKSFAGSAIVAPLVERDLIHRDDGIQFSFKVNGVERQHGHTGMMVFSIEQILASLVSLHPLHAGDLIFTGTPKGVGPVKVGDKLELSFTGTEFVFSGEL